MALTISDHAQNLGLYIDYERRFRTFVSLKNINNNRKILNHELKLNAL